MASIFMMLAITACHTKNEDPLPQPKEADHTVLMYLNGDNSLTRAIATNFKDAAAAVRDSVIAGQINLVIFKDNRDYQDEYPKLFWLCPNNNHGLDTILLHTFDMEMDIMSPEIMKLAINTTFKRFDTSIKGMIFGGHALGWSPAPTYQAPNNAPKPYFGIDEETPNGINGSMELWQFREVLEDTGLKLDYLLFDACNMGGVEAAYEYRDWVHYMLAAPTEIEGNGFPYRNVITRLAQCRNKADLPEALDYCAKSYYNKYRSNHGATISLYDLSQMNQLALLCLNILSMPEAINKLAAAEAYTNPENLWGWQNLFQSYGRKSILSSFYFYDVQQVLTYLDPASEQEIKSILSKIVLSNYHTSTYHEIKINSCCGISMALPPCFRLYSIPGSPYRSLFSKSDKDLYAAYKQLQWGQYYTK